MQEVFQDLPGIHLQVWQYIDRASQYKCVERLAGEEGLEPSHAGIKIRCLNQLGDSPTQDTEPKADAPYLSLEHHPDKG
jgi:hypothetical protein